jgi:hypothetical protein
MRLIEKEAIKGDSDPKALAAYGMLVRTKEADGQIREQMWLRFVEGRPVSTITTQFLEYSCQKLAAMGKKALLMIWDNARAGTHLKRCVAGSLLTTERSKTAGRAYASFPVCCPKRVRG